MADDSTKSVMSNDLLKPIEAYSKVFQAKIKDEASKAYDELVAKAETDITANRQTIKQINDLNASKAEYEKQKGSKEGLKVFLIVLAIILIVGGVLFCIYGYTTGFNLENKTLNYVISIFVAILCIGLAIGIFILVRKTISKSIKAISDKIANLDKQLNAANAEANQQMAKQNALYDWNMANTIISKAIPVLELDKYLDSKRQLSLIHNYGMDENLDPNYSSLYVQSGNILGNPFMIQTARVHNYGPHTYTGTRVITYTRHVSNGKGGSTAVTVTQTLTATITKPAPHYRYETVLLYGNPAAPDLVFSRQPQGYTGKSAKEIQKAVKSVGAELQKKSEKSIKNSGGFTPLSNTTFEALFHAWNRNNEQQFRLLFTPLAQQNIVEACTSTVGYGDDFQFYKQKMMNAICSKHSQQFSYDGNPNQFITNSHDKSKTLFINYVCNFFKNFYFDMVPLLSIPLYQQMQSLDYMYGEEEYANFSSYEHEVMANAFDPKLFQHPETTTPIMLKTSLIQVDGKSDKVKVTAKSYKGEPRTTNVPVMGGDGLMHLVPVHWTEYFERSQETTMEVKNINSSRFAFNEKIKDNVISSFINQNSQNGSYAFQRGLIALLVGENYNTSSDSTLSSYFTDNQKESEEK